MYNLREIMIRAWANFRKGGITFGEALHRSWLSAKAAPVNAAIIEEAKAEAGIDEECRTWSEWKKLGFEVIHGRESKSVNWKPNTKYNYCQKAEKYIMPKIGNRKLTEITAVMCQRLINSFTTERKLNPKTVKNLHSILHSSLEGAVKANEIPHNPASGLELPRITKPILHPLMDDDIGILLKAADGSEYYDFIVVAIFTGMRISELIGLKWKDVSFKDRLTPSDFSTTTVFAVTLSLAVSTEEWCTRRALNPRPADYESAALSY